MQKTYAERAVKLSCALMVALFSSFVASPAAACGSGTPVIGTMCLFAGNFEMRNYLIADGRLLKISEYASLHSLIGTTYGGDGTTTFALPDLRGRVVVGTSPAFVLGALGGTESTTLTVDQIPSHSHEADVTTTATEAIGNTNLAHDSVWARDERDETYYRGSLPSSVTMSKESVSVKVGDTGRGQSVSVMQPYIAMNWQIAYEGVYPSRRE